jgi:hypothetical protein
MCTRERGRFDYESPQWGGGQKWVIFLGDSGFWLLKNFPKRVLKQLTVDLRISRGSFFDVFLQISTFRDFLIFWIMNKSWNK